MICISLWFVLFAFIPVSIIGHVFVAAPTKLQFFFLIKWYT